MPQSSPQGSSCWPLGHLSSGVFSLRGLPAGHPAVPSLGPSPYLAPCRAHSYLDIIEQAISEGDILLIENIGETVDPVLDPLLGRNTIKKGK